MDRESEFGDADLGEANQGVFAQRSPVGASDRKLAGGVTRLGLIFVHMGLPLGLEGRFDCLGSLDLLHGRAPSGTLNSVDRGRHRQSATPVTQ
jgi:hypothetical protein